MCVYVSGWWSAMSGSAMLDQQMRLFLVSRASPFRSLQLLALVHRAALLSQLRQLGLSSSAVEAQPLPGLAQGAVQRLEVLLRSDTATASQVLAVVDELLDDAADVSMGGGGTAGATGGLSASAQRSRRHARRRQQEREQVAQQLSTVSTGVDWTLLERNRSMWHAELGPSALQRRLQRRRDQHRAAAGPGLPPADAAAVEAAAMAASAGAEVPGGGEEALPTAGTTELMLAGALLQQAQEQQEEQQQQPAGGGGGSSQGGVSPSSASATAGTDQPDAESLTAVSAAAAEVGCSATGSQAEGALCPICLDLPADVALAPCSHRACLTCCGRLASYCTSSSFGLPLQSPLCPLVSGALPLWSACLLACCIGRMWSGCGADVERLPASLFAPSAAKAEASTAPS